MVLYGVVFTFTVQVVVSRFEHHHYNLPSREQFFNFLEITVYGLWCLSNHVDLWRFNAHTKTPPGRHKSLKERLVESVWLHTSDAFHVILQHRPLEEFHRAVECVPITLE
ncbi:hypothetical protein Pmani_029236 [Petrolisthes manimaculis]|uniref:Uncharacterized protein n=1 Tax=Petrolisthes manimaculis TaxID=1843537 RepID=A0AAE1NZ39_9EUCA|nr:hypothetical protein Pmani_029236 [Petrolisthes manimaculis]